MYVTKHHQLTEQGAILALIEAHPLAAWVCHSKDGLMANHIPFFLDRSRGKHGALMGHVARAISRQRRVLQPSYWVKPLCAWQTHAQKQSHWYSPPQGKLLSMACRA